MSRDERMLRHLGINPDNGGHYRLPNGRLYYLRPRATELEVGDRAAWVEYQIRRGREYSALTDAIRDHSSQVFCTAFRAALHQ